MSQSPKLLKLNQEHFIKAKKSHKWTKKVRHLLSGMSLDSDFYNRDPVLLKKLQSANSAIRSRKMIEYPFTYFSPVENPTKFKSSDKTRVLMKIDDIEREYNKLNATLAEHDKIIKLACANGPDSPEWFALMGLCQEVVAYILYPMLSVPNIGLGSVSDWKIYYSGTHYCLINNCLADMISKQNYTFKSGDSIITTETCDHTQPLYIDLNTQADLINHTTVEPLVPFATWSCIYDDFELFKKVLEY